MPNILHIETSENICSVAISKEQNLLASREISDNHSHASKLGVITNEVMKECKISFSDLNAIAVSKGPGSYTGLRIGVSFAKGLCYALNIPLIGISTLEALCHGYIHSHLYRKSHLCAEQNIHFCPVIDARRMEVYSCLIDKDGKPCTSVTAKIIDTGSFHETLERGPVVFIGSGAHKCQKVIRHDNAFFEPDFLPRAHFLIPLALKAYSEGHFEDSAYFEPFYLKDFVATTPKEKVISQV